MMLLLLNLSYSNIGLLANDVAATLDRCLCILNLGRWLCLLILLILPILNTAILWEDTGLVHDLVRLATDLVGLRALSVEHLHLLLRLHLH